MGTIFYETDHTSDIATISVQGKVTMQEVRDAAGAQMKEKVTSRVLWDFRNALIIDADLTSMRDLVAETRCPAAQVHRRKVAVVVTNEMHAIMGRLYLSATEQMAARSKHEIFQRVSLAEAWLTEDAEHTDNVIPFPKSENPALGEPHTACG